MKKRKRRGKETMNDLYETLNSESTTTFVMILIVSNLILVRCHFFYIHWHSHDITHNSITNKHSYTHTHTHTGTCWVRTSRETKTWWGFFWCFGDSIRICLYCGVCDSCLHRTSVCKISLFQTQFHLLVLRNSGFSRDCTVLFNDCTGSLSYSFRFGNLSSLTSFSNARIGEIRSRIHFT